MNRAIFPGTFDPFTIGHYSVVRRALTFMDEVVIGIGINENKNTYLASMFTWIKNDALDSPLVNDNTKQYLSKYFSLAERNDSLDTLINNAKNEISGETDITDNSKNIDENVR